MIKLKGGQTNNHNPITDEFMNDILKHGISEYTTESNRDELGKLMVLGVKVYQLLLNHHVFSPKGIDDSYLLPEIEKVFWEADKSLNEK